MSKILEALEKAKQDGSLAGNLSVLEERSSPAASEAAVPAQSRGRPGAEPSTAPVPPTVALDLSVLSEADARLQTIHNPLSPFAEQYRSVRSRIERLGKSRDLRVLAVTSAEKGEGKSVTAANLSVVFAQSAEREVLLLDADLRRPTVHSLFGLEQGPGLSEYLAGEVSREAIGCRVPFGGLSVVTAGRALGHPGELLASARFAELLSFYRSRYDHVIIDTPPLQPVSDVSFLVEAVDGVVLVVWSGRTGKEAVSRALEMLPPEKIVGAVLNRADRSGGGAGGYGKGYYGYGPAY